ncbi:hypothetical protein PACTADRAFT_1242 [Pachysolen tannophilus NRRL Y-2460]|uniref:CAF1B/HIR1 beta-propeller domain-containing protein n=1 Tax=Pachysolen tannophilus NRRL Y-2460 TaxID=669874 RepID=A0A1E4TY21_PACTA|nr:hypothetical protein PACTADRAFT_1242 [Pachysolen tannophilus NRRL Y-2460]
MTIDAATVTVHWHDENQPIYSVDFQPNHLPVGKNGKPRNSVRLATGGGDNNVRIWKLVYDEDKKKVKSVDYLCTLTKHTQAVNVVRFDPKGEFLATAGDDGTILIWQLSDHIVKEFGSTENDEDVKESWILKHACRSSTSEIYDLAWSPDSKFILTGSMDNVTRIYNASNGQQIKQIAEHNHYVQGVAWDPKNEFIATQSADRSVHIYKLNKTSGGNVLNLQPTIYYKITRAELPTSRVMAIPHSPKLKTEEVKLVTSSSNVSIPGKLSLTPSSAASTSTIATPTSTPLTTSTVTAMNPPTSHKRKLSTSSTGSSSNTPARSPSPAYQQLYQREGASPQPLSPRLSVPLPAVRAMEPPILKNCLLYHNETLQSFFRRLCFSPDGNLLLTPSGIFKNYSNTNVSNTNGSTGNSTNASGNGNSSGTGSTEIVNNNSKDEFTNTVYIYTRAGLNRAPVAHLPGLKRPSIAVRFSPILYTLRHGSDFTDKTENKIDETKTEYLKINQDGSVAKLDDDETVGDTDISNNRNDIEREKNIPNLKPTSLSGSKTMTPVFKLPYRMVFAVATQDSVIIYDTESIKPIVFISNLHYSTLTDLAWSNDGETLIISSTDGFCSAVNIINEFEVVKEKLLFEFNLKMSESVEHSKEASEKSVQEQVNENIANGEEDRFKGVDKDKVRLDFGKGHLKTLDEASRPHNFNPRKSPLILNQGHRPKMDNAGPKEEEPK